MMRLIRVVPYDPTWPLLFREEALKVTEALGEHCVTVHHVGSTSVPGLAAKPVIDMIPVVKDILAVDEKAERLKELGYTARGELGMAFRRFFQKGGAERTHHLHVWEEGHPQIQRHLLFRDYIIEHPLEAQRYESLKHQLAARYPQESDKYTLGKDNLINEIVQKTGYEGLSMVEALTDREWEAYKVLTGESVEPQLPNHFRFVLSKGVTLMGALHIVFDEGVGAEIEACVVDAHIQGQGLEQILLEMGQRWISHQGRQLKK